ncbi:hypothetical protein SEVIR_6G125354v4 [Setaria viridis]|uniref:Uncharacterized protein n=1 Tax=Setaria viridis TaxID=4556 RepID=A0A4U6U5U9_SETVI|nr:hypothetical protein SEVIR_6G125354v2 [Setaria viridis]
MVVFSSPPLCKNWEGCYQTATRPLALSENRSARAGSQFLGRQMQFRSADSGALWVDPPDRGSCRLLAEAARLHGGGGSWQGRMGTRGGSDMALAICLWVVRVSRFSDQSHD